MANVISTSRMVGVFQELLCVLEAEAGGPVHLARMKGSRCSFVAGEIPREMPCVVAIRIMLAQDWVLLVYPADGRSIDRGKIQALFESQLGRDVHAA